MTKAEHKGKFHSRSDMSVPSLWQSCSGIYLCDPLFVQFLKQHLKGLSLNLTIMGLQGFLLKEQNTKGRANRNCKRTF